MADFLLPDLGEGLDEAEIIAWHVRVGDRVEVDQIIVDVETAKAAVEVPVPFSGTVSALHAEPGATLKVGQPLVSVAIAGADPTTRPTGFREPGAVTAASPNDAVDVGDHSGNVLIGYGTSTAAPPRRRRPSRSSSRRRAVPVVSPLVRKIARDAAVDLSEVPGTGPGGVIRRCDVELAVQQLGGGSAAAPALSTRGETRIPLRGVRKAVADKLSRSRREIPEATVWVDADATELLAARAIINARIPDDQIGVLALLARFTVLALRRYPELNGRIGDGEIVIPGHIHLGFAAQTERGLVVPVVHNAHQLTTRELSTQLSSRTAAARAGRLGPAELSGGTITVNNYGVFGVDGSAAIINHPEVAIIGMGRIIDRPWVVAGELSVRKVTQLTLAFDHRVCDGGTAGGFLRYLADCIETPIAALADL